MSKIDDLYAKYCPDGIEYRKISDISDYLSGMSGVSHKWEDGGNCLFIDYMNVYKNLKVDVSEISTAVVKNKDNQTIVQRGDILLTSASETPDECAISSVVEDEIEDGILMDDHLFGIRIKTTSKSSINPTFINYLFHSNNFRKKVNMAVRGVTRFYIIKKDFMELKIPVPPIEIQNEIVKILDTFNNLQEELKKESIERKKQYEYYKDKLLDFDWKE